MTSRWGCVSEWGRILLGYGKEHVNVTLLSSQQASPLQQTPVVLGTSSPTWISCKLPFHPVPLNLSSPLSSRSLCPTSSRPGSCSSHLPSFSSTWFFRRDSVVPILVSEFCLSPIGVEPVSQACSPHISATGRMPHYVQKRMLSQQSLYFDIFLDIVKPLLLKLVKHFILLFYTRIDLLACNQNPHILMKTSTNCNL